jgi:hypothetical protein
MCALRGVLGGAEHWTDAVVRPGVFTRNTDAASRRRERMNRVAAANRVLAHYRMNLADWQRSAFVLSTATGKTEIVDNLAHLWLSAERLLGRSCDPLDEELIAFIAGPASSAPLPRDARSKIAVSYQPPLKRTCRAPLAEFSAFLVSGSANSTKGTVSSPPSDRFLRIAFGQSGGWSNH